MKKLKKIILLAIALCVLFYLGFKISKSREFQFFGGIIKNIETNEKVVALTFDDGPTNNTDKILDKLDSLDIKATFFVTGNELEQNLEKGKKIVDAGHELGNHTYSHNRMVLKSYSFTKEEIEKTDRLIRDVGYTGDIQFRPPYFKKLIFLPYYLFKNDRKTILCDVEPETALGFSAGSEEISDYVISNTKEGSIILMHVMYDSRVEAFNSLEAIVDKLKEKGYKFVTVSELLKMKNK